MTKSRFMTLFGAAASLVVVSALIALPAQAAESDSNAPSAESEYTFEFNGQSVEFADGESITFPMVGARPVTGPGDIANRATYPGNCGVLTVTASAGVYHYGIAMTCPATFFAGNFSITDLTSGLGGGSSVVYGFSGSVTTSKLRGHRYSGTLTGNATLAGMWVASPGPNNTIYQYNG